MTKSTSFINVAPSEMDFNRRQSVAHPKPLSPSHPQEAYQRRTQDLQFCIYPPDRNDQSDEEVCSSFIGQCFCLVAYVLIVITFPFSLYFCLVIVQEHERAVLFRNGRLLSSGASGPGVVFVLPLIDNYYVIDLRTVCYDVPPQKILTKDSITIDVDAVMLYRVCNPVMAITNVADFHRATRLLAATTLRNMLGTERLEDILSQTKEIGKTMRAILDDATDLWGIKVSTVAIKNITLPLQLQRAMAAEAQATREARAKVVEATGEHNASHTLAKASEVLASSPTAIHLRFLQALSSVSVKQNKTIVFPLPVDIFSGFVEYFDRDEKSA